MVDGSEIVAYIMISFIFFISVTIIVNPSNKYYMLRNRNILTEEVKDYTRMLVM